MSLTVSYNNQTIAALSGDEDCTLKTGGKFCEGDISLALREAATVVQPLSATQNGTYTPPDGVDGYAPVTVNVSASVSDIETASVFRWNFNGGTSSWGIMKKLSGGTIGQNCDRANTNIPLVGDLMTVTFHGLSQNVEVVAIAPLKLRVYTTGRTLGPAEMTAYTMAINDQQSFTPDSVYGGLYIEAESDA